MSAIELRKSLKQVHTALYDALDLRSKLVEAEIKVADAANAYRDRLLEYRQESIARGSSRITSPTEVPEARVSSDNDEESTKEDHDSSHQAQDTVGATAALLEAVVVAWRAAISVDMNMIKDRGALLDVVWAKLKTIPKPLFGAQHAGAISEQFWRQYSHMELRAVAIRLQAFSTIASKARMQRTSSSSSLSVVAAADQARAAPAGRRVAS